MKFSIITLFPEIIEAYVSRSIMKRAVAKEAIEIEIVDLRAFSNLPHHQVDDYQYGGGSGMVLMVEPVVKAIESVKQATSLVVLTSAQGRPWNQTFAKEIKSVYNHVVIVCGHYEGFDERVLEYVDQEISIGDYILTGGELPALVLVDSISRILPLVIAAESSSAESFEDGLLDYPAYTKPLEFRGSTVPEVLLSGHHAKINQFRAEQRLLSTLRKRPDLLDTTSLAPWQLEFIKKNKGND